MGLGRRHFLTLAATAPIAAPAIAQSPARVSTEALAAAEFDSIQSAIRRPPLPTQGYLRTAGYFRPGDGGGALYVRANGEPKHPGKMSLSDGSWWELAEPFRRPQMFGARGDGITPDTQAIQGWLDAGGGELLGHFVVDGPIKVSRRDAPAPSMRGQGADKSSFIFKTRDAKIELSGDNAEISSIWFNPALPGVDQALILGDSGLNFGSHRYSVKDNHFGSLNPSNNYFRKSISSRRLWYSDICSNSFVANKDQNESTCIHAEQSVNITCADNTLSFGGTFLHWDGPGQPYYNEGWTVTANVVAGASRFFVSNGGILAIIKDNVIDLHREDAITAYGTKHIIEGNWIGSSTSGKHAVVLHAASHSLISNNIFILAARASGIRMHSVSKAGSDGVSIRGNEMIGGAEGIVLVDPAANVLITDNKLSGQTDAQIRAPGAISPFIRNNRLLGPATSILPPPQAGTVIRAEVACDQLVDLAGGQSQTFTVAIAPGVFQTKPKSVSCNLISGTGVLAFYDYPASSAQLLLFKAVPRSGDHLPVATSHFSIHAMEI